jgi:ceramide glucosyltransferase
MIVTHGPVWAVLSVLLSGGASLSIFLLIITLAMRYAVAWTVGVHYLGDSILRRYLWMLPVSDFISFYVWVMGIIGKKVEWRGRIYDITRDGKMRPLKQQ